MAYKRKSYQAPGKQSTFTLNITSMTDMFTILLVFLLQTFGSSDLQVTPEDGINLPISSVETNPVVSLKLSLSKNILKMEEKQILQLTEGQFQKSDLDPNDKNFLPSLFSELDRVAKESTKEEIKDGRILLQADSSLSYDTIRKIMYTASMAGFPKLKMAVVVGE